MKHWAWLWCLVDYYTKVFDEWLLLGTMCHCENKIPKDAPCSALISFIIVIILISSLAVDELLVVKPRTGQNRVVIFKWDRYKNSMYFDIFWIAVWTPKIRQKIYQYVFPWHLFLVLRYDLKNVFLDTNLSAIKSVDCVFFVLHCLPKSFNGMAWDCTKLFYKRFEYNLGPFH